MEGLGSQASPAPNLRDSLQIAMGDRTPFPERLQGLGARDRAAELLVSCPSRGVCARPRRRCRRACRISMDPANQAKSTRARDYHVENPVDNFLAPGAFFCLREIVRRSIVASGSSAAHLAADLHSNAEVLRGAAVRRQAGEQSLSIVARPSFRSPSERPSLMSPGGEKGAVGLPSSFGCPSTDSPARLRAVRG